jgi:hypothetical protein
MTNQEAIKKIQSLLGLTKEAFAMMKTEEGVELRTEEMEVGAPVYIVTPEGEKPCMAGSYKMEDGTVVKVDEEGVISALELMEEEVAEEEAMEEEVKEEEEVAMEEEVKEEEEMEEEVSEEVEVSFVEAELIDGTLVTTEEAPLEVGSKLMVVTEEGKVEAPAGEHTTTTDMVVTVGEGGIIEAIEEIEAVEDEAAEEVVEETVNEVFTSAIEKITTELKELKAENAKLKEAFAKFSNKPAGAPIKAVKTEMSADNKAISKLAALRAIKNNK